ncbi:MAG: hypothetical protein M4D80_33150 [Myxococcota bacterium]|nr:hypothetical protein [Myxococcota bacterium]
MMRFFSLILLFGCAGDAPDGPSSDALAAGTLDRHRLLEDSELEGDQSVTAPQIQALLENEGSALAGFVESGRSAAQWIVDESVAQGISPVYMVARIETESGLVRSGTLAYLLTATGCACPDGEACDPSVAEFGLQVRCAAELARSYLADIDARNATISGWGLGVGKYSLEGCYVEPQTRATAALYTYTPWVGAYATCGTREWGGSSLVAVLTREFADALPAATDACLYGDGDYCGGNGIEGDVDTLYTCSGGALGVKQTCAAGCYPRAGGENDECVDRTQTCTSGNGLYCGNNGIVGDPGTLYRCSNGIVTVEAHCGGACEHRPTGVDDACL